MKIFLSSIVLLLFSCGIKDRNNSYELYIYDVWGTKKFDIKSDSVEYVYKEYSTGEFFFKDEIPKDINRKLQSIFKSKLQSFYKFDRNEECIDIRIIRKTMEETDTITIARVSEHEFMESDLNQIHPNLYEVINYFDKENFIEININDQ